METVKDVKDALSARSRTATLEQLASEGRKKVRLIKAEHVAAMIHAAVHSAIDGSGLVPKEDADRLVERSREEFRSLMREREDELGKLAELQEALRVRDEEISRLTRELENARSSRGPVSTGSVTTGGVAATGTVAASALAGSPDLSAAIEKLAGSLNDRLEKLGKKMGISAAVEGEEVKFDGLFKDTGKELESNMGNIEVKQKAGGGIAANLARLKKLKGGG